MPAFQLGDTEVVSPAAPDLTDDLTDSSWPPTWRRTPKLLLQAVRRSVSISHGRSGKPVTARPNSLLLRRLQAERPGDAR